MATGAIVAEAWPTTAAPGEDITSFDNLPVAKPVPRRTQRALRREMPVAPEHAMSLSRGYLRRQLEAHLTRLGYSTVRAGRPGATMPEIVRISPVRGRIAYGETVLGTDLRSARCHQRLVSFAQRRTRHRSTILFFIGVAETDRAELETLLERLEIRSATRGGHVHVVPFVAPERNRRRVAAAGQGG
ncbi:MAG: hypothetical protein H6Q33_1028 [Deltaproteobacteria bacterium]|jgi:hypothetical protein|nr:hypothetical protein [Deltaproteobacteria bacterium]